MVFGAALFCRPNFALLAPVVVAAFWRTPAKVFAVRIASASLIAALTFALAGIAAHGRPFWPRNGPYNLYAGNNPFSGQALLEKLNAEPSIYPAFRATHSDLVPANATTDFYYSPALQPIFTHDALIFVVHHPDVYKRQEGDGEGEKQPAKYIFRAWHRVRWLDAGGGSMAACGARIS